MANVFKATLKKTTKFLSSPLGPFLGLALAFTVVFGATMGNSTSPDPDYIAPATEDLGTEAWSLMRIVNNGGGDVSEFLEYVEKATKDGTRVEIDGECASACTLFLSVPNVCAFEGARLGFHSPYQRFGSGSNVWSEDYTIKFLHHYPKPVQEWVTAHGGLGQTLHWMMGDEVFKYVPKCPDSERDNTDIVVKSIPPYELPTTN